MSYIAETFIFIYLGMDALDWEKYDSISFRYEAWTGKKIRQHLLQVRSLDWEKYDSISFRYEAWTGRSTTASPSGT